MVFKHGRNVGVVRDMEGGKNLEGRDRSYIDDLAPSSAIVSYLSDSHVPIREAIHKKCESSSIVCHLSDML